eukprot:symbB.v1.2.031260.t1/scaffold3609.1/size53966/2
MSREGQATCRHILQQMKWERPPWHASADEHAVFLQTRATELMTQAFPKQRRAPKPSWIQDDTWDTISQSRRARRHLQKLKEFHRAGLLGAILHAWRDRTIHPPGHFRRWVREHDHAAAYQLHVLRHSRTARARCLARDQSVYLDNLAVKQTEDLSEAKGTELWKKLRFQLPKFRHRIKRPLPHCGAQDAFLEHFADIEEAQITELKTLAVDSSVKSYQGLCASLTIEMKAVDLPTIFELEEAIRSVACRKSSLGAFPIELMRADPALSAEILMPLMLDFFKHFQQPITWKGGSYYPLFKGKGSYQLPGNFRAILIAYSVPKLFHRIVRARLARQVAPQMLPFQIGGIKQMSVHFAVQFLNELRARSNRNKCSSAVLFFDLKSAFYRAQHSRIVDDVLHYDRGEDEDITLDQLGKPPALDDLQVFVVEKDEVQEQTSQLWNGEERAWYKFWNDYRDWYGEGEGYGRGAASYDDWYGEGEGGTQPLNIRFVGQDRSEKVMVSRRGTRAGDPIADLAFTCIMRSVLQQFMEAAQQVLPLFAVDQTQKRTPAITWVDDVAIFLEDECADTLVAKVRQTVAIMHAKCRSHGLDLNFAKGKTEAMFRFQGRNAVQWRQQLYLDQKLNLGEGFWQHIDIPVTSKYTHLGVVHASNCSHEPELSYRLGRARAALQECRKQILQQKAIRWQNLLCYHVARVILGCENYAGTQHWTDSHIAAQLPIPAVEDILASARLRYFARVWAVGPVELRQLLIQQDEEDNDAWLQRLRLDMVWLQSKVPNLKYLPAPTVDFEAWIQKASGMQEWHAMVGQALQAATIQRHYAAKHHQWKLKLQEILRTVGFNFHEASVQKPVQPHACNLCEARFSSYKALTVHHYKQHGRHAAERLYMEGTVCFSCLKDFHTTQRLRQHLQWKPDQCLHHLQQVLEPFAYTDVPLKDSLKTAHRVPAIRLAGPRLPTGEEWRQAKPDKTLPLSLEGDTESGVQEEVADGPSTGEDDQDREHPGGRPGDMVEWAERLGQRHGIHLEVVLMPPPDESFLSDAGAVLMAQKECSGLKEAVAHQRSKFGEVDHSVNALNARIKELQHSLDEELQKRADSVQKLDSSVKELGTTLETEVATRQSLAEEVDHVLKAMKSKVKNLVCEQGELSRQAIETARKQLQEQLDREVKSREAIQSKLQSACEDQRLMLLESSERNETLLRELERRFQEQLAMELKDVEASQARFTEETHRQLRDLRESSEERLAEERQVRESQTQGLEDHVDFLEGFLQDARELFLQRGSRQRRSKISQSPRPLDALTELTPTRRLSDTRGGIGSYVND